MVRFLWLSLFIMNSFDSHQAKEELSMWNLIKVSNDTNLYPPQLFMQPPIAVPALTYFEPVAHDHSPVNVLKKLIKTDRKRWKNEYLSSDESSSSDSYTDTDTDTDTSDSDSDTYY